MPSQFQALVTGMAQHQVDACKEVRKKGRNKQHATNCRSKKDIDLNTLKVSLFGSFNLYFLCFKI